MYDEDPEDTYGSTEDEPAGGPSEDVSSEPEGDSDADAG